MTMKVKIYRGEAKPEYLLYIEAGSSVNDLSAKAKQAVEAIGALTLVREEVLGAAQGSLAVEIISKVASDGAYFVKHSVEFTESIVTSAGVEKQMEP